MAVAGYKTYQYNGYLVDIPNHEVVIIDDSVVRIHTVVVHQFIVTDMDDPDLHAADPILAWQKSEKGQWVMSRAHETPTWNQIANISAYNFTYYITAKLKDKDYTFYQLKWS